MRISQDLQEFCKRNVCAGGGIKSMVITLLTNPCFHSVCLYRISSFFYKIHLSPISKIIWYFNRMIYHIDIDYRSELAGGFVLVHGLGTVIGKGVVSKGRLTVYQHCTLGGNEGKIRINESGKRWSQPILMDGVVIYTGAGVFGPVIISNGTHIKAGQIISHDF